ncbi:ORF6N domain-containing protein [Anaerostipes caccae]|uniref:ORF6N domain-containing protein n=1 Tax=Anaerostipes caccae TaxID=105841 RepID=UPI0038D35978
MQELTVTKFNDIRVLTTQQIADAYETESQVITNNFNRNKDRYASGKHFICLTGNELRNFRAKNQNDVLPNANRLYLWTKKGAFLHAKSLNTDKAWEVYDKLVDHYFDYQEEPSARIEDQSKKPSLASVNTAVSTIDRIFSRVGVDEMYIAAEAKRFYREAGYPIEIPLITDKEMMPKLYDCTEIAIELGIMSKSGKPHNQAVGDIIRKLDITDDETKTTAFSKNGHGDVTVQFLPSVVEKVKVWLEKNQYPTKIAFVDSKGNSKTRTVVYRE